MNNTPTPNDSSASKLAPPSLGGGQQWPIDALRPHPEAGIVPPPSAAEYALLYADIAERGILAPLDLTAAGVILDGRARLTIMRELGHATIPGRTVTCEDELDYIVRAALNRRQLDASVKAAIVAEQLKLEQLRAEAKERQLANLRQNQSAERATLPPRRERTRDLVARLAGTSPRTAQHVLTVEANNPELFEEIKQGRIPAHRAARRVQRERLRADAAQAPPLPSGLFEVIYADPAWQMNTLEIASGPEDHYKTMTLDQIKALEIPAAKSAVLFLWRVTSLAREALDVIDAWGFEYRSEIVWVKPTIGPGTWVRHRHETLLIATRGGHPTPDPKHRPDSVVEAPRGKHSQKPEAFYELIEAAYPNATRLELFARGKARPGWTFWGDQAER